MIVTPTPFIHHFKYTLKNKSNSQNYETPDFESEIQKVQSRVKRIQNGEEEKPLAQARLSWEDEQVLHQFDDQKPVTKTDSSDFQKEYQRPAIRSDIQIGPDLPSDNLDETL